MRLLIDQDVYALTIKVLRDAGHDVVCVAELGKSRAPDSELLDIAAQQQRVLVTRDLDFGRLIHAGPGPIAPVVIVRATPVLLEAAHRELVAVLTRHVAAELAGAVVIVEPSRYRIRRLLLPPTTS